MSIGLVGLGAGLATMADVPTPCGSDCVEVCNYVQGSINSSMEEEEAENVKSLMGAYYSAQVSSEPRAVVITAGHSTSAAADEKWYVYECIAQGSCSKDNSFARCGMESIDMAQLMPGTTAFQRAVQAGGCPCEFDIDTITLYWYDVPVRQEPTWTFISHEGFECQIGAHTGAVLKSCPSGSLSARLHGIRLEASAENVVPVDGELAWFIQEESGTTGYTWCYMADSAGICDLAYEFSPAPSIPGVGGGTVTRVWVFQAVREGVTELRFGLYRFCSTKPEEIIVLTVRGITE